MTSRMAKIPPLNVLVGKGGVGRSTVTAAMALAAMRRGNRVLVIEIASRQVVPEMFGLVGKGYEPVQCLENLWCIRVSWQEALKEYSLMKLKFKTVHRIVFENPLMARLLPAIPGIPEIVAIGKVVHAVTNGIAGLGRFDAVFLDAPATGHAISLLSSPVVVLETVPAGPLAQDARHLAETLLDNRTTVLHIVSTPEEMPVVEAGELYRSLAIQRGFTFGPSIMNAVEESGLTQPQREAFSLFSTQARGGVAAATRAALFMDARYEAHLVHIERLKTLIPLPVIRLPYVVADRSVMQRIERLAEHLDAVLWREL